MNACYLKPSARDNISSLQQLVKECFRNEMNVFWEEKTIARVCSDPLSNQIKCL